MPGTSDSHQPDDIRIHLEQILTADDGRAEPISGESEDDALFRESLRLPLALRRQVESARDGVASVAPGLSAAEVAKLTATRAGRDALEQGFSALARVDSHLQSITGNRNPLVGRKYGVYGSNPRSFAGVFRALTQSADENARIGALPEASDERQLQFTPIVKRAVDQARDHLQSLLGDRVASRADLRRQVDLKDQQVSDAVAVIGAVRNHLYANLPLRKKDPDLHDYGFRPVRTGYSSTQEEIDVEVAQDQ